jgi:hypothetical protein
MPAWASASSKRIYLPRREYTFAELRRLLAWLSEGPPGASVYLRNDADDRATPPVGAFNP